MLALWIGMALALGPDGPLPPLPHAGSVSEWESKGRPAIRRLWEAALGPAREKPPRVEWSTVEEETLPTVTRRRIRYRVENRRWTEAYLLFPRKRQGRAPGVVVFHSTTPVNMRQPAGVEGEEDKAIGLRLAERGFVALCPRCYIYDDPAKSFGQIAAKVPRRHPSWTGMRQMEWDGERALDLLASLPEVDPNRLGAIGHSLGAKETLYLAAFDPRVKAAVFSEGGMGMASTNWEAEWYLGPQVKRAGFGRDHHELLALCAPRPFLLLGGDSADGAISQPYVAAAEPLYWLYGARDHLKLVNHKKGHAFPPEAQEAAYAWLEKWLKTTSTAPGKSLASQRQLGDSRRFSKCAKCPFGH